MKEPNKQWKEEIAEDEESIFQEYSDKIVEIQKKKSGVYGNGRALHRKQIAGLRATLEILENLPEFAKQGLFKEKKNYEVWIRISNGGLEVNADKIPDIRGFSFKVLGVNGPSALGNGNTQNQDFTLINHSAFSFPKAVPFLEFVIAAAESPFSLLKHMLTDYGFFGSLQRVAQTTINFTKPFTGFLTESFYSSAPIAYGEYAARVRLVPNLKENLVPFSNGFNYSEDIKKTISRKSVSFQLQFQFFVNEQVTPIEDASVDWSETVAPYITVANLIIPIQDLESEDCKKLELDIEKTYFDPWNALLEHRPLGNVMRARKYIYYSSQKQRGANT